MGYTYDDYFKLPPFRWVKCSVVSYIKLRNETDGLVLSAPGSRYSKNMKITLILILVWFFSFVCPVWLFRLFLTLGRTLNFTSRSIIRRKCYNRSI